MSIAPYRFVFLFFFLLVIYLLAPLSISFPLRVALNLTFTDVNKEKFKRFRI